MSDTGVFTMIPKTEHFIDSKIILGGLILRRSMGLSIPLGNDDGSEEMQHPSLSLTFTSIGSSKMTQLKWKEFIFQDLSV